ncbi:phage tail-collar fiber domain-containing protein [Spartinivicinus ruber]|uniref:phage tail-collar fiber domain-containing protein n=1 Tax=Spartinivicinus ruber TaxID=2683272 RepID=UPI0013CFF239|nr:phage tail protein [Spartinivicinus ruber]
MSEYLTAITKTGLAKEAKARRDNTKIKLVDFAIGDGELPTDIAALEQRTELVNQQYRAKINGVHIDPEAPETIRINALIPHEVGGWFIRECGIYDSDGDLYAIANVPPTYKNGPDSGAKKEIGLNVYIATANTQQIDLTIDPDSVIATREMLVVSLKQHKAEDDPHPQYVQQSQLGKAPGDVSVVGDFGLGQLENKTAANVDELITFGFYRIDQAAGTLPTGIGVGSEMATFYVEVLPQGDQHVMQRLQHTSTTRTFERRRVNGEWLAWREVVFVDAMQKAFSNHEAEPDPHPQYIQKTGGNFTGEINVLDNAVYHEGHKPSWEEVTDKPADYPPATHNHDDVYFKLDHRTKSVWVDVTSIGQTGDIYTALNWAKTIHPDDTFQDNDHMIVLYSNQHARGTGNGTHYWNTRHMVTFLRSRSGWHLLANQPGREPA